MTEKTKEVNGKMWLTRLGAMERMCVKSNTLTNEIKEGRIAVFHHPAGDLFSDESIDCWIDSRTSAAKA